MNAMPPKWIVSLNILFVSLVAPNHATAALWYDYTFDCKNIDVIKDKITYMPASLLEPYPQIPVRWISMSACRSNEKGAKDISGFIEVAAIPRLESMRQSGLTFRGRVRSLLKGAVSIVLLDVAVGKD